ncbi:MAG: PAS domain-containing protein [Taibaiella sp.]|nr:PAS domain-containing protein [Taibaiella sp.]
MESEVSIINDGLLRNILASGPGLVTIVQEDDLKLLFVNNAFEHYLGYSAEDLDNGLCFIDLIEEQQQYRFSLQLQALKHNYDARSHYIIYNIKCKNGTEKPFYLYAAPVELPTGRMDKLYHLVLHPDLSKWGMPFSTFDTKEMFLEQFESENFGTFEWLIGPDKIYCSAGVYNIYEINEKKLEITNAVASSFIHPDDREGLKNSIKNSLIANIDLDIEFKIVTPYNHVKIIHCIAKITKNNEGKPTKCAGSLRDVTKQRNIEEHLKFKVEELYQSNKELEEFAYVASHDMQEPLRKITTFSSRLMEKYGEVLTGDGAMYLTRMAASADNMRRLINDLLDFSRISNTEQPFEKINLNVTLREIKADLELVIEETGTEIISGTMPEITGIHSQMKQLFTNIISNAIKFHRDGVSPLITITSTALTPESLAAYDLNKQFTYYKITITDNGIGFEEEYATRIFKVFQRLHGKSEYPGSGIGLAICKKIVEHHNGVIYGESQPGEGASFTFIIPSDQPKPSA